MCESQSYLPRPIETDDPSTCEEHPRKHNETESSFLIRDILHALLVPIVELFDRAFSLAVASTHPTRIEDLEHAFSGQGRSAFLWLQCFLASQRERDWCYTNGCPICVAEHSLDSEFSVRMLYAACLLSDVHYPFTLDGPKLPSFRFFLEPLERVLSRDPLYGEGFFERMQPKAVATRNGIEELIHQCVELDMILSQPPSACVSGCQGSSAGNSGRSSLVLGRVGSSISSESGMKVKRGAVARRQMGLQLGEEQWMEQMLRRCWDQL